jgi:3-dehydroquinate synthase class II
VDATAKTITVTNKKQGTKTFAITDSTKLTKTDGTVITLADIKPGDHVHGSFDTKPDGTLEALTVKAGPKTSGK